MKRAFAEAADRVERQIKLARLAVPMPPASAPAPAPWEPLGQSAEPNLPPHLGLAPDGKLATMAPDRRAIVRVADSRVFVASLGGARAVAHEIAASGQNPHRIGVFNVSGEAILHPETKAPLPHVVNAETIDDGDPKIGVAAKALWLAARLAEVYWMLANYKHVIINCKFGANRSVALAMAVVFRPLAVADDPVPPITIDGNRKPSVQLQAEMTTPQRTQLWNAFQDWIVEPKKDAARHFGIKGGWKTFANYKRTGTFRPGDEMQLALWTLLDDSTDDE